MTKPPGTIPGATLQPQHHPRRPPAHQSVSLRHSPPANALSKSTLPLAQRTSLSSPNGPASDRANPPSSVSAKLAPNKQSSGESSDAGRWFESTNNNAVQSNASYFDNDPPFFLRNSSSSGTPPDGLASHSANVPFHATKMPLRPTRANLGTGGSSTEDFKSVIDDLTVANKKLKQKLRKYERLYDDHLQDEKLFEVRFHGLPDHKKKELEDTLRKFAASLDDPSNTGHPPISHAPQLDQQKSLFSQFAESGYASMSASGQNSISVPSNQASIQDNDRRKMTKSQYNRQQQSIHSYLHDIPAGLLPKHQVAMSDKSRKKLVVCRLEQIYAGKRSTPGSHPHPMQQEEVAQSAAQADRRAKEATGQHSRKEGNREARIMPVQADDEDIVGQSESLQKLRPLLNISEQEWSGSGSPDQRPTRPLDLDPYRAQVPLENMDYIRHLGFTPPDMASEEGPEDGHGWIYLNLLINMAQLHTINVTPDFVKEAVTEYSSKFELSHDGRKVRWRGGEDISRNSSDSSSEQLGENSPYGVMASSSSKSPSKEGKTGNSGHSSESMLDPERQARRLARAKKEREQNKLFYKPLFFHKDDSEDDDDFYNYDMGSSSNSLAIAQARGDSSGFGSSAIHSSSSRKRRDDGPIIFYSKAKFCTDLSGDRRGLGNTNSTLYNNITAHPLGATPASISSNYHTADISEPRGPLDSMSMEADYKDSERSSSEGEIGWSPESLKNDNGTESPEMIDFEACGLGGVQPDDNFSIRVRRSHAPTAPPHVSSRVRKPLLYPAKILKALGEQSSPRATSASQQQNQSVFTDEIISASHKSLPSSTLPPASFLPFDSTSSGDVDSDLESNVSSSASTTSSSDRGPETAIRMFNMTPNDAGRTVDQDESTGEASDVESDTDDSVDLLATARQLDPKSVHAHEREYDAALAERLADDIPAGSSAATAGGGSGFNSPSSVAEGEKSVERNRQRSRSMRQSTTSGSMSSRARNLKRAQALQGGTTHKKERLE